MGRLRLFHCRFRLPVAVQIAQFDDADPAARGLDIDSGRRMVRSPTEYSASINDV